MEMPSTDDEGALEGQGEPCSKSGAGAAEAEVGGEGPAIEGAEAERTKELERELERLREELISVKEERMRLLGSVERLLRHLIDVAETVERVAGLYSLSDDSNARSLSEGLRMISSSIERVLREEGVEVIGKEGETFDPVVHEAIGFVGSEQHEDGTVVSVVERGFAFRGKVLRPAKVVVAKRAEQSGGMESAD